MTVDQRYAPIQAHMEKQKRADAARQATVKRLEAFIRARLHEQASGGDPRVLREVEAKRRLLDEVLPVVDELDEIAYSEGQCPVPYGELRVRMLKLLALMVGQEEEEQDGPPDSEE